MIDTVDYPSGPSTQYFHYLRLGQLMLQRSRSTGQYVFYPRVMLPGTGEVDLEWVEASGYGHVYSCTRVPRKPERGGDYCVALVELEEGPRMMTNIEGVEAAKVYIGMSVKSSIVDIDSERPRVVFTSFNRQAI
jgi:uncharacterized OB-fold protein